MICKKHPRYIGKSKPKLKPKECLVCWLIYLQKHSGYKDWDTKVTVSETQEILEELTRYNYIQNLVESILKYGRYDLFFDYKKFKPIVDKVLKENPIK